MYLSFRLYYRLFLNIKIFSCVISKSFKVPKENQNILIDLKYKKKLKKYIISVLNSKAVSTISNYEFKGFKTTAEDSLVWRLSIVLAHCLQSFGGIKAFCHMWYEFVQEMRYRWEKCIMIPG